MIDLLRQVDEYCERADFYILAEPLNLFSNLFFWIAAGLAIRELIRSQVSRSWILWGMVILLFLVGLGSGLFHSLANQWSKICDVGFIGLFVLWFLWFWTRNILQLSIRYQLVFFALFLAVSAFFQLIFLRWHVNGSQGYFGVAIFLLGVGWQQSLQLSQSKTLMKAGWVFVISLLFRTLDEQICSVWPYGTHFLWHSLNAVVCYMVIRGMREELEWQRGCHGLEVCSEEA